MDHGERSVARVRVQIRKRRDDGGGRDGCRRMTRRLDLVEGEVTHEINEEDGKEVGCGFCGGRG